MSRPLQVLIVEDSAQDGELIVRALRHAGFEPVWERVDTEAAYLEHLRANLDVILSDCQILQPFGGFRALELLRERGFEIPIIIISNAIGEETVVEAMKLGAVDYLFKDRLARLGPAIDRAMEQARLCREHQRTEDELRLFRALVDQSNDTFEVVDPETGRFLDVNEKGPAELGCSRAEYLSMTVFDVDPNLTASFWEKFVKEIRVVGFKTGEGEHLRKDGTIFPIEFNGKWVHLDRDYLVTVVRDITERKQGEEAMRRLNAELERRVAERTAELEAANKELEAFSYSISHDLRAPLRTMDGFSQTVLDEYGPQLPEKGRRSLRTIREGAQRMGRLIDDLLTFSRLSRAPLNRRQVDTAELVRSALSDLRLLQEGRQVDLRIGDLPASDGDPALLKQVWVNLLSNALKYTGRRETAVVEIGCSREAGEQVWFVRDNGAGFDMRHAGQLFGVFHRLHRAEDYEGTGVGLAIVQRIVHRHGGRVWADAAVDGGAAFFFTLEGSSETPKADH